jgi:hypothetical protein
VSHAKADRTRPSAIVHDMNAVDHDRRASTAPVPWRSLITRPDPVARYLPVATGRLATFPPAVTVIHLRLTPDQFQALRGAGAIPLALPPVG